MISYDLIFLDILPFLTFAGSLCTGVASFQDQWIGLSAWKIVSSYTCEFRDSVTWMESFSLAGTQATRKIQSERCVNKSHQPQ